MVLLRFVCLVLGDADLIERNGNFPPPVFSESICVGFVLFLFSIFDGICQRGHLDLAMYFYGF